MDELKKRDFKNFIILLLICFGFLFFSYFGSDLSIFLIIINIIIAFIVTNKWDIKYFVIYILIFLLYLGLYNFLPSKFCGFSDVSTTSYCECSGIKIYKYIEKRTTIRCIGKINKCIMDPGSAQDTSTGEILCE